MTVNGYKMHVNWQTVYYMTALGLIAITAVGSYFKLDAGLSQANNYIQEMRGTVKELGLSVQEMQLSRAELSEKMNSMETKLEAIEKSVEQLGTKIDEATKSGFRQ